MPGHRGCGGAGGGALAAHGQELSHVDAATVVQSRRSCGPLRCKVSAALLQTLSSGVLTAGENRRWSFGFNYAGLVTRLLQPILPIFFWVQFFL